MHFLLLGATGRTGSHVVKSLLEQGHTAVALVRNPSALPAQPGLTVIRGSPLSKSDIALALSSTPALPFDAAIFTLNAPRTSDSPFAAPIVPLRFLADCAAATCAALSGAGVRRVVIMSTAGVGDSWKYLPLVSKAFLGLTNVRHALDDHDVLDREMRERDMDWTLVRAVRLVYDKERKGEKLGEVKEVRTLGSDGKGMGMMDSVNVDSVARFMVKVAVEGLHVREAVVVRN